VYLNNRYFNCCFDSTVITQKIRIIISIPLSARVQ